ncbi:intraflagellar transport 54 isoform 2-T2 [Cochliomyia hominivorax]
MTDDINPSAIKRTQDTLGKYVKRPNLTDKLLKKPPFRFLHDVFNAVIRDTGCFVGLYTQEELTYENIKDRDDKMKFLQKMIDVVIRTSKIVAGHEPEKTNELLQLMGEIIEKNLDWQAAVEKVLAGKTPQKETPRKPKDNTNKTTKDTKTKDKSKEKESKNKDPKAIKTTSNSKTVTPVNKDEKTKINKTKDKISTKPMTKEKSSKASKEPDKPLKKSTKETSNGKLKLNKTESIVSSKSPSTANTQESKEQLKSKEKEFECKHEEENVQTKEPELINATAREISNSRIHNEISNINKISDSAVIQQDSLPQDHSEEVPKITEKPKKSSAKSRKSSAQNKMVESFGEKIQDKGIKILELTNQEKSESSETAATASLKQETSTSSINPQPQHPQQQQSQKHENINSNQSQSPTSPPQPQSQKQSSPPVSLTNELKGESTFTRENSKESSSNQSSLVNRPRTSLRPPSARPPSARPGAPRRRDKNIEIILQPNDQIKMSNIQVKLETFGDLDDDGENLVIIENPNTNDYTNNQQTNLTESEKIMQDAAIEQGHLVQQILETQKELVQGPNDGNNQQKSDKDSTNGSVLRQTSAHHMNNLREVIQNLTKSINPLGKLMDFIPEDIDAMQLEFTMWRDAYTQAANELKREKSLTESVTEPMKNQLLQIEANILEYMEMIDASRVKILQNSEKIMKMLTS